MSRHEWVVVSLLLWFIFFNCFLIILFHSISLFLSTIKTCWMRLASFREIGNNLKERFDKASRVRVSNDFRGIIRSKNKNKKSVQLETYEKGENYQLSSESTAIILTDIYLFVCWLYLLSIGYPSPTSIDLIFFEESPDFCNANPKFGLPGTQGRHCNASSISVDSELLIGFCWLWFML